MPTALITGANRGLGKALRDLFLEAGWDVLAHCGKAVGNLCDLKILNNLVTTAERRGLDLLINNAGVRKAGPFEDSTWDNIAEELNVNLIAPIILTKGIWPIFKEQGSGMVININSLAGKQGGVGEVGYCASKHGLAGFSRALQFDATEIGVKVLSVFLGAMQTEMASSKSIGNHKLISPREVAEVIFDLVKQRDTLRITEIDIQRSIY